jgi:HAE1 family hydrophobic/amphiphilic exporter-1
MAASVARPPLEKEFSTIAGLDSMNSSSLQGTSQVTLQFVLDRDLDAAAQDVQAAISRAGEESAPGHARPRPPSRR